MKKLMGIIVLLGINILFMTGCGNSSDGKAEEKVLNVIGWSEYVPEDVIQQFTSEKGIKVNYTAYSDPDEMLAKVRSSSEGTYDMVLAPGMYVETFRELDKLDKLEVSGTDNLASSAMSQPYDKDNQYSVPYLGTYLAIAVDTEQVKKEITSYEDLLDKEFENSLVTVEDARAVVGCALMQAGYDINDTSDEALQAASDYFNKLKPNIKIFDGSSPKTSLINGEAKAGLIYGGEIALAIQNNPNIKVYFPKENLYFCYDVFMKFKDAKNPEAVDTFVEYILEPEVSAQVSEQFPYYNPNKEAVKLFSDELKENPAVTISEDLLKRSETVLDLGDQVEKVEKVWSAFKN